MNWRNIPPTVVPPGIRRASWTPPQIGTYFLRASDRSVWQVVGVYHRDQQVKLVPDMQALRASQPGIVGPARRTGDEAIYPFAAELLRDYRQVAS
jgi:hypothetical protein